MVVKNGTPFIFNDADTSAIKLRSFLFSGETSVSIEISRHILVVCFYFLLLCNGFHYIEKFLKGCGCSRLLDLRLWYCSY